MLHCRTTPRGINLRSHEVCNLKKAFPQYKRMLDEDETIHKKYYQRIAICIFDHWLTRDEVGLIFSTDIDEIVSRRKKMESLVVELYNSTEMYLWRYKRHYRPHVYKPHSLSSILKYCDFGNLTENRGGKYSLVLPEYSAVYTESFDWTNRLLFTDRDRISPLIEMVKRVGLYTIEYND